MRAIVLTKNFNLIKAANYQREFIIWLGKKVEIFNYGLGYSYYDKDDNFDDIIQKSNFNNQIDFVIFAHSWLNDNPKDQDISFHKNLFIKKDIPVIGVMNKEYVNLERKLDYYKKNKFDLIITHNHNFEFYQKKINKNFLFLPFAVDQEMFFSNKIKTIDLMFSGIIKPNYKFQYSDFREKMQNLLFYELFFLKFKRSKFKNFNIYWNNTLLKTNILKDRIERIFRDSRISYASKLANSKIVFNALSPSDLINPRFFESIFSGALPISHRSNVYKSIKNLDKHIIKIDNNFEDFYEKLSFYCNNKKEFEIKSNEAIIFGKDHTWENRVNELLKNIK